MKKIKYWVIMIMMFILTGCVKFNVNMDIKRDKSMNLDIIYAFDKSMFKDQSILTDEQLAQYEENGFKVIPYSDDKMQGFTLSKKIKDIDEVSLNKDIVYNLSGNPGNNEYLFKVEKGFFKNIYTAVLNFNSNDSGVNLDDYNLADENDGSISLDNLDLSALTKTLDMKFNVTLPYGSISNNATTKENGNKKLSWNLGLNGKQNIEFKFAIYNLGIIYAGLGLLLFIIALIMLLKKDKKNNKEIVSLEETRVEIKNDDNEDIIPEPVLKQKVNVMEEEKN